MNPDDMCFSPSQQTIHFRNADAHLISVPSLCTDGSSPGEKNLCWPTLCADGSPPGKNNFCPGPRFDSTGNVMWVGYQTPEPGKLEEDVGLIFLSDDGDDAFLLSTKAIDPAAVAPVHRLKFLLRSKGQPSSKDYVLFTRAKSAVAVHGATTPSSVCNIGSETYVATGQHIDILASAYSREHPGGAPTHGPGGLSGPRGACRLRFRGTPRRNWAHRSQTRPERRRWGAAGDLDCQSGPRVHVISDISHRLGVQFVASPPCRRPRSFCFVVMCPKAHACSPGLNSLVSLRPPQQGKGVPRPMAIGSLITVGPPPNNGLRSRWARRAEWSRRAVAGPCPRDPAPAPPPQRKPKRRRRQPRQPPQPPCGDLRCPFGTSWGMSNASWGHFTITNAFLSTKASPQTRASR